VPGLATCPSCGTRNEVVPLNSGDAKRFAETPYAPRAQQVSVQLPTRSEADVIEDYHKRWFVLDILYFVMDAVTFVVLLRWLPLRDDS
jgi:hypothetical protein